MKLVQFTREDGRVVWINSAHVTTVLPASEDKAYIWLVTGTAYTVRTSARDVVLRLTSS